MNEREAKPENAKDAETPPAARQRIRRLEVRVRDLESEAAKSRFPMTIVRIFLWFLAILVTLALIGNLVSFLVKS